MEHHVISVIQNIQTIHIVLTIVWKGGYQFTNKKNNKTKTKIMEIFIHIFTIYCIIFTLYMCQRWANKKFADSMIKVSLFLIAIIGIVIEIKLNHIL